MRRYLIALFSLIIIYLVFISSNIHSSQVMEIGTSLTTKDDLIGMVGLAPLENGRDYFSDNNGDGTYELVIADINPFTSLDYSNIFEIINNLNNPMYIKIKDKGDYREFVNFYTNDEGVNKNLEIEGTMLRVGCSFEISISVDAKYIGKNTNLIDGVEIIIMDENMSPFIILERGCNISTK